jgi:Fe-S-cluster containining protein
MFRLIQLHTDIEERVSAIREDHLGWLCRMGCDSCCRRLADIPWLTSLEWDLLQDGLAKLSTEQLKNISQNVAALANLSARPIVCPMLDQSVGACLVYDHRPVACRTYGFYVQRAKGLYCNEIKLQVDDRVLKKIVWGNQDAIDRRLSNLGESRVLHEWFSSWGL